MKTKTATVLMVVLVCGAAWADQRPALQVYLPRSVKVKSDSLSLGDIGLVRSDEQDLSERASAIAMGRAPWLKETIVINRQTILSRLAANGIPHDMVQITGAKKVSIRRVQRVIGPDEFLKVAGAFLETQRPGPTGSRWRLVGRPKDLVVPDSRQITFQSRIGEDNPGSRLAVTISVMSEGKQLGAVEVPFKLVYRCRQAVTTRNIAAGEKITPQNTKIVSIPSDWPEDPNYAQPFGQTATRRLAARTVVRPVMTTPSPSLVLVKRNQTVLLRIRAFGLKITDIGQALQEGRPGEFIKVRNVSTKRVITAKVAYDGSVEPVLEETRG